MNTIGGTRDPNANPNPNPNPTRGGKSSAACFDQRLVIQECVRIKSLLQGISDRYLGPIDRADLTTTQAPFVLILGNHSSGKSSFINMLCGSAVQNTGVAPTDDAFTLIGAGEKDYDRSGQALMEDEAFGFQGLSSFGQVGYVLVRLG